MFGFFFLFSQYLQFGRGYSALLTGVATLPFALTMIAIAPRSAALAARIGSGRTMALGFVFMAAGFGVLSVVGVSSPYVALAVALGLLAVGMSITAAPATGSIMSAVPLAKAGVGSAVNDTTRELGGALGIAMLGSVVSAAYRSGIELDGVVLPAGAAEQAEESAGAAIGVAGQLVGDDSGVLATRAADAFTEAFNVTNLVSVALVLAAGAVVAITFGRRHEHDAAAAFGAAGPDGLPVAGEAVEPAESDDDGKRVSVAAH